MDVPYYVSRPYYWCNEMVANKCICRSIDRLYLNKRTLALQLCAIF